MIIKPISDLSRYFELFQSKIRIFEHINELNAIDRMYLRDRQGYFHAGIVLIKISMIYFEEKNDSKEIRTIKIEIECFWDETN